MNSFLLEHSWSAGPWWMANIRGLGIVLALIFILIIIALKGYSLWIAAKSDHKWWFIILLFVNTLGILELIYLFFVAKKWHKDDTIPSSTNTPTSQPTR